MKNNLFQNPARVNIARIGWFLSFLALIGMACGVINQVNSTKSTAEAIASQVQGFATEGGKLVGTAQAFATQNPGFVETLQAGGESIAGTAEALATQNPGLVDTLQAGGESLAGTAEAYATQNPGLQDTALAMLTQAASGGASDQAPEDIPLLPQDKMKNLQTTPALVTYATSEPFQNVVEFYKQGMTTNGWTYQKEGSMETTNLASLIYSKGNRKAQLIFGFDTINNQTLVTITVSTQ